MRKVGHPRYLFALDVGTLGCRSVIYDLDGNEVSYAYQEYEIETPHPGWAEQNPETWWKAVKATVKASIKIGKVDPVDILALGLTGQQISIVFIDVRGRCLGPSILWADRRGVRQCEWIRKNIGEDIVFGIAGSRVDPLYAASKLLWVKENRPEMFKRISKIFGSKDYIGFRLTDRMNMDHAMASTMQLYDIRRNCWSETILDQLGISQDKFPELVYSTEVIGEVTREAARRTGLKPGTPVVAGGGDTACMALGAGALTTEKICSSLGTSANIFGSVEELNPDPMKRVSYYCHVVPGKWIIISGSTDSISLRWFRDNLGYYEMKLAKKRGLSAYKVMDEEAEKTEPGAGSLVFLPFLSGARSPIWNTDASGVFFGIKYHHSRGTLIRAVLEGIAYSTRQRIEVLRALGINPKEIVAVGGGARSEVWNQIMSDVTGLPFLRLKHHETAVLGAALLAGLAVNAYKNFEEASKRTVSISERFKPRERYFKRYSALYKVYEDLYPKLSELFKRVSSIE